MSNRNEILILKPDIQPGLQKCDILSSPSSLFFNIIVNFNSFT